jgi:hypothetical protein
MDFCLSLGWVRAISDAINSPDERERFADD